MLHEYLMSQAKDYADKKVSEADIDARLKAEITRFIRKEDEGMVRAY